jgi:hypothetical protein
MFNLKCNPALNISNPEVSAAMNHNHGHRAGQVPEPGRSPASAVAKARAVSLFEGRQQLAQATEPSLLLT